MSGTASNANTLGGASIGKFFRGELQWIANNTDCTKLYGLGAYLNATGNGSGNSNFPDTYGVLLNFPYIPGSSNYRVQFHANSAKPPVLKYRVYFDSDQAGWQTVARTTDNVASATKLATARTLWGQSFDGSGNVNGHIFLDAQSNRIFFGTSGTTAYISAANGRFSLNRATNTSYAAGLLNVVLSSGNVGIGTLTPSYKLHVVGTIYATTGIWSSGWLSFSDLSSTSDRRFKDGIAPLGGRDALAVIHALKPSTWTWNALSKVKGRSAGFVAQDVAGVLPDAIREIGEDKHLALNYQMLHAYEVAALQEHDDEIARLRKRVDFLENELKRARSWQH